MQNHTVFEQIESMFPRLSGRAYRVYPELPGDVVGIGIVRVGKFKAIAVSQPPAEYSSSITRETPSSLGIEATQVFDLYTPWTIFTSKIQLSQAKDSIFQENLGEPSIEVRLDRVASGRIGWGKKVGIISKVEVFYNALETLDPDNLRNEFWKFLEHQIFAQGIKHIAIPITENSEIKLERLGYKLKSGFMQKTAQGLHKRDKSTENQPTVES